MRPRVTVAGLVCVLVLACDKPSAPTAPATSPPPVASSAPAEPPPAATQPPAAPAAVPETIVAQHVLVAYRGAKRAPKGVTRSKAEAKARAAEALAKVRAGTSFEDVVAQYSEDPASASRMGSLGKFHKADMEPVFAAAAFALQPDQVSEPVETPFGFHIIKRTQ